MNRTHETHEQRLSRWHKEDDTNESVQWIVVIVISFILGFASGFECLTRRGGF